MRSTLRSSVSAARTITYWFQDLGMAVYVAALAVLVVVAILVQPEVFGLVRAG